METQSSIKAICSQVYESYQRQVFSRFSTPKLNPYSLTHEQAISIVDHLTNESGSMVALSFFYWLLEIYRFKHFTRLYIVAATSLIQNGNFDRANEIMQCLVRNFAQVGRLKEAAGMVLEMKNHGLKLNAETLNCILRVGLKWGCLIIWRKCLMKCLREGFIVDNSTCTSGIHLFCDKGCANRALWYFDTTVKTGFKPNLVNYSCLINGLSKKGSIKQAFGKLEEMVREGWKPNVGYCNEEKLNRAEMLFSRMEEQGLVANTNTYTTLINGHCKMGRVQEAYELLGKGLLRGLRLLILFSLLSSASRLILSYCLFRKLCSERKVGIAALFFHRLLDKDHNVDRVTLAAFVTASYEPKKSSMPRHESSLGERMFSEFLQKEVESFDLFSLQFRFFKSFAFG
ncbi:hypothetical protein V6N13_119832 [Hibiscus sabdariffa]